MIYHQEIDNLSNLRLIVIDDDVDYCAELEEVIQNMGHSLDIANDLDSFKEKIIESETKGVLYAVALIDMNFMKGDRKSRVKGNDVIKYIKDNHKYIACILVSGDTFHPDAILDFRDKYGMDYSISKDQVDSNTLSGAIQRAIQRARQVNASQAAQRAVQEPLSERQHGSDDRSRSAAPTAELAPPKPPPPDTSVPSAQVVLDFQLHGNIAQITWRAPLIGRKVTTFTPPYTDAELPLVVRALDALQYLHYPTPANGTEERHFTFSDPEQGVLDRLGLWQHTRLAAHAHRIVGQALYDALGPAGQDVLGAIRNAGIAQGQTTNYVLRFPPEGINLAALPWELLWDRAKNQAVLIRGNTIDSCERYVDIDMAIPPPHATGHSLHVLALSPMYQIPAEIREQEHMARCKTWDKLQAAGKITYAEISPLTMAALNDYLLDAPSKPDVIHYFGHGTYREGQGYLLFDDGDGGRDMVSAERLAAVLGDVRLVVILACQSAMADDAGGLLTGVAPALSIVTGAVVAMQLTVRITSAMRFAQVFYDQLLGRGRSLQDALARGRHVLFTEAKDGASWYVPTLYIRSREPQPVYLLR